MHAFNFRQKAVKPGTEVRRADGYAKQPPRVLAGGGMLGTLRQRFTVGVKLNT